MVGTILIVDDVATNRIVMKVKLAAAGYRPIVAHDGQSCLALALAELPDLILLDLELPGMSGIDALKQLRAEPLTRSTPIAMISAGHNVEARTAAFRAGADEFMVKPIDDQTLLARIRGFLRAREITDAMRPDNNDFAMLGLAEPAKAFEMPGLVALITANPENALKLRRDLDGKCSNRAVVMTAEDAMEGPNSGGVPDVYVIEADLATTGGGLRLMSELRGRSNSRHAAFCLLVAPGSTMPAAAAFDLGASDMVPATIDPQELSLRLARLLARKRETDLLRDSLRDGLRLAVIDPLTGLHNRRYGIAQLSSICEQSHKSFSSFAVMLVDLDRFKSVNDRWGHAAGDAVLIGVAERLTRNLRDGDLLARIGGEEFLIALPGTTLAEAQIVAERLCQSIEELPVTLQSGTQVRVTVSIGLAINCEGATPTSLDSVPEIMERADRALLIAKSGGRNQVTISQTAA